MSYFGVVALMSAPPLLSAVGHGGVERGRESPAQGQPGNHAGGSRGLSRCAFSTARSLFGVGGRQGGWIKRELRLPVFFLVLDVFFHALRVRREVSAACAAPTITAEEP